MMWAEQGCNAGGMGGGAKQSSTFSLIDPPKEHSYLVFSSPSRNLAFLLLPRWKRLLR
jgi:hypothetical protein